MYKRQVVEGAYFFKVIQSLYFKGASLRQNNRVSVNEAPVMALVSMFLLLLFIIVIGIYPKIITGILNSSAGEFLNRMQYIKSVFGG